MPPASTYIELSANKYNVSDAALTLYPFEASPAPINTAPPPPILIPFPIALVSGVTYTPAIGDVVIDSNSDAEYVCISVSGTTYTWERLGRDGSLALSSEVIHKSILAATGDMIYASAANTPATLSIGNSNQVLRVSNGGLPSWGDDLAK